MKRMTIRNSDWTVSQPTNLNWENVLYRLADYEDTGLEPGEIADFMNRWERAVEIAGLCKKGDIDHIRDLLQAEKDGRLVVLGEGENHG